MAKDEREASACMRLVEGGQLGKKMTCDESDYQKKTEPVGVLGRARVKHVSGMFVSLLFSVGWKGLRYL